VRSNPQAAASAPAWSDLFAELPSADLSSPVLGRGALGQTLKGARPAPKGASRWESPWLAIGIGSLMGAVAAGGWLVYRLLAG
jgi:hypothetical protein